MTPSAMARSRLFPVLQGVTPETAAARIDVLAAQARAARVPVEAHARTVYVSGDGVLCLRWTAIAQRIADSGRYRVREVVAKADRVWLEFLEREDGATWSWAVRCEGASCGFRESFSMDERSERPRNCRVCTGSAVATEIPSSWRWLGDSDQTFARAMAAGALTATQDADGESYDPAKDPMPTLRRRALMEGARAYCSPIFFGVAIEGEITPDAPPAPAPTNGHANGHDFTPLYDRSGSDRPEVARVVPPDASMEELLDLAPGDGLPDFAPRSGAVVRMPRPTPERLADAGDGAAPNNAGEGMKAPEPAPQGVPAAGEGAPPPVPSTDSSGGRADAPSESTGLAAVAGPASSADGGALDGLDTSSSPEPVTSAGPGSSPDDSGPGTKQPDASSNPGREGPGPCDEGNEAGGASPPPPAASPAPSYTELYVALSRAAWDASRARDEHGDESSIYLEAKARTDAARDRLRAASTCWACSHPMCDHAPEGCEVEGCACALSGYDADAAELGPDQEEDEDYVCSSCGEVSVEVEGEECASCLAGAADREGDLGDVDAMEAIDAQERAPLEDEDGEPLGCPSCWRTDGTHADDCPAVKPARRPISAKPEKPAAAAATPEGESLTLPFTNRRRVTVKSLLPSGAGPCAFCERPITDAYVGDGGKRKAHPKCVEIVRGGGNPKATSEGAST